MAVPKEFLEQELKLPSPPTIALRLLEAVNSDSFSFEEIAKIIQSDPALAARVLKMVNSGYYSLPNKITNIERALTIMGVHAVKNIALSFTLVEEYRSGFDDGVFSLNYFWKRAITCAAGSEVFSRHLGFAFDDTFITALLQDISILVYYRCHPEKYGQLLEERRATRLPIDVLEKRAFGFDHQELGSEILREWGLPESVHIPIRYHHNYASAPAEYRDKTRILYLSHAISSIFSDQQFIEKIQHFAIKIKEDLGISDAEIEALVDETAEIIIQMCSCFEIPAGDMKPLSRLLQEANEGLSELNLSYEKLLEDLRREKIQVEKLAKELKETNDRLNEANRMLKETSIRDHLTGLYNRRYMIDILIREMKGVRRYGGAFSLMILDIDYFKKINDSFGHNGGDLVLKAISDTLTEMTRATDIVARYGGEEFIVVLPGTGAKNSLHLAERIRTAVEEREIRLDGQTVRITVSIGTATCVQGMEGLTADEFIDTADRALYDAKKWGRNRVATADQEDIQDARIHAVMS